MILSFDSPVLLTNGQFPDLIQFYDTSSEVFYLDGGELMGIPMGKNDGDWSNLVQESPVTVSPDLNMTDFELKVLNGFGAVGSYRTPDAQKMIIYEFAFEMDRFLESGSIKMQINNPINSFALTLANPIDEGSEEGFNVAISEKKALLAPGAKVIFKYHYDEEEFNLGSYYIDRSNFSLLKKDVSVDGRNLIGKALKDQTLDEQNTFAKEFIHTIFETMLTDANLSPDQFMIETSTQENSFEFKSKSTYLKAMEEVFKSTINWKMEELMEGTIIIGSPSYSMFNEASTYTFERDKDIFSRKIVRDDNSSYSRVCVHDKDMTVAVYKDVEAYSGWNINAKKTLYAEVPLGTTLASATLYADELASQVSLSGKIESFTGPFKPWIMPGDGAEIIDSDGSYMLGLITDVEHKFGKGGYFTNFTVDSGGQVGKGRISDYINQLKETDPEGSIGY